MLNAVGRIDKKSNNPFTYFILGEKVLLMKRLIGLLIFLPSEKIKEIDFKASKILGIKVRHGMRKRAYVPLIKPFSS